MPRKSISDFLSEEQTTSTSTPRAGFDAAKYQELKAQNTTTSTQNNVVQNDNLGTGFDPTFESNPDDSLIKSVGKTLGNAPKSGFELGKNLVSAVVNPIDTVKGIGDIVRGAGAKVTNKLSDVTGIKQAGVEGGKVDTSAIDAVGSFYKDRYGSRESIRESLVEDPFGVAADAASVATGGAGALRQAGNLNRSRQLSTLAKSADPTAIVSGTANKITNSAPVNIVKETIPNPSDIQRGQVAKALELTPGDLSRISEKTGNDVTQFVADNRLFRDTPEEMTMAMDDLKVSRMAEVRSEIAKVNQTYSFEAVPNLRSGLQTVLTGVDKIPGLEEQASALRALLQKKEVSLSDVQAAKELIDANSDVYTKMGDTKSSATNKGLANIRSDIKNFIETEVTKASGGEIDIRKLNNDVQTSKELSDAVVKRETRNLTRQSLTVFDGILGIGSYSQFGAEGAIIALVGKKVAETPTFRLALARVIQAQPVKDRIKMAQELKSRNISPETQEFIDKMVIEARNNMPVAQSGANMLDNVEETIESQDQENQ